MLRSTVKIVNDLGLHTRAATLIVKQAARFSSDIYFASNGLKANAKSIMGLLALGARKGCNIEVEVTGEDQGLAMDAMVSLITGGFYEATREQII